MINNKHIEPSDNLKNREREREYSHIIKIYFIVTNYKTKSFIRFANQM